MLVNTWCVVVVVLFSAVCLAIGSLVVGDDSVVPETDIFFVVTNSSILSVSFTIVSAFSFSNLVFKILHAIS